MSAQRFSLLALAALALAIFPANGQIAMGCAHHGDCGEDEFCSVLGECVQDCMLCFNRTVAPDPMGGLCPACPNVDCQSHNDCHCVDYCTTDNWCTFSCMDCAADGLALGGACPECPNPDGQCDEFVGSCANSCGGESLSMDSNCFCNELCSGFGDCCSDFEAECPLCQGHHECGEDQYCSSHNFCETGCEACVAEESVDRVCPPCPNIHGNLTGTCEGSCGGQSANGDCFCNARCAVFGDCCDDFDDMCGDICQGHHGCGEDEYCGDLNLCVEGCAECETNGNFVEVEGECPTCPNVHGDTLTGSCGGGCGGKATDGDCFCNILCFTFGDCCRDYENFCEPCQAEDECEVGICLENGFCGSAAEEASAPDVTESPLLSSGAIVGIAIAGAIVVILLVAVFVYCCRSKRGHGEIATESTGGGNSDAELDEVAR